MNGDDTPLFRTLLIAAVTAIIIGTLAAWANLRGIIMPFNCPNLERSGDLYAPGCRAGEYGNGLAYDPCRDTREWSCNPRDARSRAFASPQQ